VQSTDIILGQFPRVNLYLEWEFIFLSLCSRMDNSMSLSLELLLEKVWSCSSWMKIIMFTRRPQMLCIVKFFKKY